MIKKRLLVLGVLCVVSGVGVCCAEEAYPTLQDGLMDRMSQASASSSQGNSIILKIKERTNSALLNEEACPAANDVDDFSTVLSLQERLPVELLHVGYEAPDSMITKKKLEEDLQGHMRVLVGDFFKTKGYAAVKKNLATFNQFVFSCPEWQGLKNREEFLQKSLEDCSPEGCFKLNDNIKISYIYEDAHIVGALCLFKISKKISPIVTIDVCYEYKYLFAHPEKRLLFAKSQEDVAYLQDGQSSDDLSLQLRVGEESFLRQYVFPSEFDVIVSPGHSLSGSVCFVCTDEWRHPEVDVTGYIFYLNGAEAITLTGDFLNFDSSAAAASAWINNKIFYTSFFDPAQNAAISSVTKD